MATRLQHAGAGIQLFRAPGCTAFFPHTATARKADELGPAASSSQQLSKLFLRNVSSMLAAAGSKSSDAKIIYKISTLKLLLDLGGNFLSSNVAWE